MLHQYQYGIPASFSFQPNPVPHRELNSEQEVNYRAGVLIHDEQSNYFKRLWFRFRFIRFFLYAPLYVAAVIAVASSWRIIASVGVFLLGTNLYPFFYPHYMAAVACLFVLLSVSGLEKLNKWRTGAGTVIVGVCIAQFLFWYGIHGSADPHLLDVSRRFESWDYIDYGDPQYRRYVAEKLAQLPGKQLVFVRYSPEHVFAEWVHNDAQIDTSRVVLAHDLGVIENQELLRYYPERESWLLEPDENPPVLRPYKVANSPFVQVQ
jgi:hypothetical protein